MDAEHVYVDAPMLLDGASLSTVLNDRPCTFVFPGASPMSVWRAVRANYEGCADFLMPATDDARKIHAAMLQAAPKDEADGVYGADAPGSFWEKMTKYADAKDVVVIARTHDVAGSIAFMLSNAHYRRLALLDTRGHEMLSISREDVARNRAALECDLMRYVFHGACEFLPPLFGCGGPRDMAGDDRPVYPVWNAPVATIDTRALTSLLQDEFLPLQRATIAGVDDPLAFFTQTCFGGDCNVQKRCIGNYITSFLHCTRHMLLGYPDDGASPRDAYFAFDCAPPTQDVILGLRLGEMGREPGDIHDTFARLGRLSVGCARKDGKDYRQIFHLCIGKLDQLEGLYGREYIDALDVYIPQSVSRHPTMGYLQVPSRSKLVAHTFSSHTTSSSS